MKNKIKPITIVYWICGFCLFAVLLFIAGSLWKTPKTPLTPQIVFMGDSIVGECRDEQSIPAKVQNLCGMTTINGAFGGTRISRLDPDRRMDYQEDGLSVVALTKSMVTGDFGVQQMIHVNQGAAYYFDEAVDTLAQVDYDKVEILILAGGINDYHNGILPEDPKNPYNEYTFAGALRSSLTQLQKKFPGLRIILVSPTYSWYGDLGTCETRDMGNGYLEDYVEVLRQVAEEYDLEWIDLYHDFYPHETEEDRDRYTRDGVHPNEEGRQMIAERIAQYLKEGGEDYENTNAVSGTAD